MKTNTNKARQILGNPSRPIMLISKVQYLLRIPNPARTWTLQAKRGLPDWGNYVA
jgi:hypothetical protein